MAAGWAGEVSGEEQLDREGLGGAVKPQMHGGWKVRHMPAAFSSHSAKITSQSPAARPGSLGALPGEPSSLLAPVRRGCCLIWVCTHQVRSSRGVEACRRSLCPGACSCCLAGPGAVLPIGQGFGIMLQRPPTRPLLLASPPPLPPPRRLPRTPRVPAASRSHVGRVGRQAAGQADQRGGL